MKNERDYFLTVVNTDIDTPRSVIIFMLSYPGPRMILLVIFSCLSVKLFFFSFGFYDVFFISIFLIFRGCWEWAVHRYLHHAKPIPFWGISIKTPIYDMHKEHHRNPGDIETFLFGARAVLAGSIFIYFSAYVFFGDLVVAFTAVLYSVLCLLIHELVHVFCHSPIKPKSEWFARILVTHRKHHFVNANKWYGVSSPVVDRVFRTGE